MIRGGDGMAGLAIRHPSGQIIHPYQWQANSDFTDGSSTGGYYSICIDNQFSRFAVSIFILLSLLFDFVLFLNFRVN